MYDFPCCCSVLALQISTSLHLITHKRCFLSILSSQVTGPRPLFERLVIALPPSPFFIHNLQYYLPRSVIKLIPIVHNLHLFPSSIPSLTQPTPTAHPSPSRSGGRCLCQSSSSGCSTVPAGILHRGRQGRGRGRGSISSSSSVPCRGSRDSTPRKSAGTDTPHTSTTLQHVRSPRQYMIRLVRT